MVPVSITAGSSSPLSVRSVIDEGFSTENAAVIDRYFVIVDGRLDNDLSNLVAVLLECSMVAICDFVRLDENRRAAFHVQESRRSLQIETELQRIIKMEHC